MIEVAIRKRERSTQIRAHALPAASDSFFYLIVNANTHRYAVRSVIQESGFQPASEITHARAWANIRIGSAKSHPRNEMVYSGVRHLFKVVVANVRAAADTQHAEKE